MYLCNWWRLTKRRVHEREVEVAFSGQRVAAEGHGDLLHRDLETSRRERFHEDVSRPTDSSKRGRAVGRHRVDERQRRLVRSEERANDATAVTALDRDRGPDYFARRLVTAAGHAPYAQGRRYGADGDGYSIYLTDPEGTVVELKSGN